MQTFLPYADFDKTAQVLDRQRLGKQRVETMQIMSAFLRTEGGWINHPATRMWRGYGWALLQYQKAIVAEWLRRGYNDNVCMDRTVEAASKLTPDQFNEGVMPPWLGDERVHQSHRSALRHKRDDLYAEHFPNDPVTLDYVWPV